MFDRRRFRLAVFSGCWALLLGAAADAQFGGPPAGPGPDPLFPNAGPIRSCESLMDVSLPDTTIESAEVDGDACRVTAVTTHPPENDRITIWLALPMNRWNGRFLGNGGGGFSGGSPGAVNGGVAQGFAAGSTDTRHEGGSGAFALGNDGRLNWQLIRDNGHLGIHEMTVTGQALTEAFYGQAPGYSYFNGCSTGGRQGLMEAQRYPNDYDGVEDGLIGDPTRCDFDASELIGTSSGDCGTITAADASIINRLWDGPTRADGSPLWIGAVRGSNLASLSATRGDPLTPQAMGITLQWFQYFLTQDPDFDWTTVTPKRYERLFEQSVEQFGLVIGTDNPDLRPFRDAGGKVVVWHGWSDPLISAAGTLNYYERVLEEMGGQREADDFIRLFMAPGVGHCGGGGSSPTNLLDAVITWVEEDEAPESLAAAETQRGGDVVRTRPLCPYPEVARYSGRGSTDEARSFVCSEDF